MSYFSEHINKNEYQTFMLGKTAVQRFFNQDVAKAIPGSRKQLLKLLFFISCFFLINAYHPKYQQALNLSKPQSAPSMANIKVPDDSSSNLDTLESLIINDAWVHPDSVNIATITPGEKEAVFRSATICYAKKEWQQALIFLTLMDQCSHTREMQGQVNLLKGICFSHLNNHQKAEEYLLLALNDLPILRDHIYYLLAENQFYQNKYNTAQDNYLKIVTGHPSSGHYLEAITKIIDCEIRAGDPGLAIQHIDQLIKKWQDENTLDKEKYITISDLLWLKSRALRKKKDYQGEVEVLSLLRVQPDTDKYYYLINNRLNRLEDQGIISIPEYGPALLEYVKQLGKVWAHNEIVALVDRVIAEIHPQHPLFSAKINRQLRYRQAYSTYRLVNYAKADSLLTRLLQDLGPINDDFKLETQLLLARVKLRGNKISDALVLFQNLYTKYPKRRSGRQAHYMLIWAHAELNDFKSALASLKSYRRSYTRSRGYKQRLDWTEAWFTYRLGNYAQALQLFKPFAQRSHRAKYARDAKYWSARCLQKLNKKHKAKKLYLELTNDFRFSYYRLAAVQRLLQFEKEDSTAQNMWPEWKQLVFRDSLKTRNNFSLNKLRQAFNYYQNRTDNYVRQQKVDALNNIRNMAELYKESHPSLYKAMTWYDLGDAERASFEFSLFFDRVINGKKIPKPLTVDSSFLSSYNTNLLNQPYRQTASLVALPTLLNALTRNGPSAVGKSSFPEKLKPTLKLKKRGNRSGIKSFNETFFLDIVYLLLDMGKPIAALPMFSKFYSQKFVPDMPYDARGKILYPLTHLHDIQKNADFYGVPEDLIISIMRSESRFKPEVISSAGAIGLMQILQCTGLRISQHIKDSSFHNISLFSTEKNIQYGTWYLGQLLSQNNLQVPLAIASYNAGPAIVNAWLQRRSHLEWDEFIESIRFFETRFYVKKVLQTIATYRWLYYGEFSSWDITSKIDGNVKNNINW